VDDLAVQVAREVRRWLQQGEEVAFARITERVGFGGGREGELVARSADGRRTGSLLGPNTTAAVLDRLGSLLSPVPAAGADIDAGAEVGCEAGGAPISVAVAVHGPDVAAAGLACGGDAVVTMQTARRLPRGFWELLADAAPVALLTWLDGPAAGWTALATLGPAGVAAPGGARRTAVPPDEGSSVGARGGNAAPAAPPGSELEEAARVGRQRLAGGSSGSWRVPLGSGTLLVDAFCPPPTVLVVGEGDLADALCAQADLLGWGAVRTPTSTGSDPVPTALEILDDRRAGAAVIVLSHDPAVDAPVLARALEVGACYVGALGSRATQEARRARLAGAGVPPEGRARLRGPAGLDLGGQSPALVALAICAEIQSERSGRRPLPLTGRLTPIRS